MKFALLNSVIMNGGDAGIVYGIRDAVEEIISDAHVSIFAHMAQAATNYYPDLTLLDMPQNTWPKYKIASYGLRKSFPLRSIMQLLTASERKFYKEIQVMDALIYCGGGYINNLYSTDVLFRIMQHTLATGIPHMAYAHSIGPFYDRSSQNRAAELLSKFKAITVRDEASYHLLHQMGVNCEQIHFTADAAFAMNVASDSSLLEEEKAEFVRIQNFKNRNGAKPLLFMSAREWKFPHSRDSVSLAEQYKSQLRYFVKRVMNESDYKICFVSTCQGRKEYNYDDALFAKELLQTSSSLPQDRIYVCGQPFRPFVYPLLIRQFADIVLSMRMHFIIFSIMAGVPFIAIAYEKKSQELARQVGVEKYCHELSTLNADLLYESFLDVQHRFVDSRKAVEVAYQKLRTRSLENAKILKNIVMGNEKNS